MARAIAGRSMDDIGHSISSRNYSAHRGKEEITTERPTDLLAGSALALIVNLTRRESGVGRW